VCSYFVRDDTKVIASSRVHSFITTEEEDFEERCLVVVREIGLSLPNSLASTAALELERRFPRRVWEEAQGGSGTRDYLAWVVAEARRRAGVAD